MFMILVSPPLCSLSSILFNLSKKYFTFSRALMFLISFPRSIGPDLFCLMSICWRASIFRWIWRSQEAFLLASLSLE